MIESLLFTLNPPTLISQPRIYLPTYILTYPLTSVLSNPAAPTLQPPSHNSPEVLNRMKYHLRYELELYSYALSLILQQLEQKQHLEQKQQFLPQK